MPEARRLRAVLAGAREAVRDAPVRRQVRAGLLELGEGTYGAPRVRTFGGRPGRARIGSWCSIADGVELYVDGAHRTDWVSTFPHAELAGGPRGAHLAPGRDVTIGSDVWLGSGCCVLPGVTIGHGAVVGARAVVAADVRPYAVVVGNPAREVRRRFSDADVDALLASRWWELQPTVVGTLAPLLCAGDVGSLVAAVAELRAERSRRNGSSTPR